MVWQEQKINLGKPPCALRFNEEKQIDQVEWGTE
jgi:hypothetical protein